MYLSIGLTALVILTAIVLAGVTRSKLTDLGASKQAAPQRAIYISKVFNFGLAAIAFLLICFLWGLDHRSLILFSSSMLAVMGVAFVAQWSLLSNITASIIIFFTYPARIGDVVKIIDGDNSVQGTIKDITLFQVLIESDRGELVSYPNNLIVQKPLIKSPSSPSQSRFKPPREKI